MFSVKEIIVISLILILILREIFINFTDPNPINFWSPTTIIVLIFLYYVIVGPIVTIINKDTVFRLFEHRQYMINTWILCLIGLFFILIGYRYSGGSAEIRYSVPDRYIKPIKSKYGVRLFVIGLVSLFIFAGIRGTLSQIKFWDPNVYGYYGYSGSLENYFYHAIDMFIPAGLIITLSFLSKRIKLMGFIFFLFIIVAIFTKQGFRWRLVMLGISMFMSFYLYNKRKPGIAIFVTLIFIGVLVMGAIGITRHYGRGLDFSELQNKSNPNILVEGITESSIFMSTGLLVENIPKNHGYIYFDPIIESLVMPVPRKIWPGKPSGDYIHIYESMYYLGNSNYGLGVAVMNFGEYYLAFGYIGVILGSLLIGYAYRKLWEWFKLHTNNSYAIAYYTVAVSFLYMIFSRGYLPQVTMLFFFTVFPAYIVFKITS